MKKALFFVLVFFVAASLSAQWYFDGGIGIGGASTREDGKNIATELRSDSEVAVDLGLKIGYDFLGTRQMYLTGEISGVGHRFAGIGYSNYYIQCNSYLIGPGFVYYPHQMVQLSVAAGLSYTANQTDIPYFRIADGNGFAFNLSGAADLGQGNSGLLVGIKYHYASNDYESISGTLETSFFGVFARYRFRN